MKQGSADDPFAEDREEQEDQEMSTKEAPEGSNEDTEASADSSDGAESTGTDEGTNGSTSKVQRQSLPYIHARNGVKDGRTQRPVFLREDIENGIDSLVNQMEERFDESVYKTDVTEAAMVVAQENPELVAEVLEEWGYGWT